EAWAAGTRPPPELPYSGDEREDVAPHDPDDPFDGLPHDEKGATQVQGLRQQGPVQAPAQVPRLRLREQGQASRP
ncbi:hypothetical protein KI387_039864, partial [Taxus chinensis]